jgi:Rrf2 family protein
MKRNSRLSAVLHLLLHMGEAEPRALTSEQLASFIHTNPVVVRRIIAGLREAGIVVSGRGPGGGWRLGRPLDEITLAEISTTLGETLMSFSIEPESPGCLVEQAVLATLADFRREAEQLLLAKLSKITLADLAANLSRRPTTGTPIHAV